MTDTEKLKIAMETLNFIQNALKEVKNNAYKDSEESFSNVEKGAYYTGKYEAYNYASCFVQQEIRSLNKLD